MEPTLATEVHALAAATGPRFARALRAAGAPLDAAQQAAADALARSAAHGAYLWGPVGRGKTLLAEQYFAAVPTRRKRRFHVHGFFRELQAGIVGGGGGGVAGALGRIVGSARAVLFDEFHVHDVADAVYLTTALRWLRERDVLLIATSNYAPQDLLPDPLFHHFFVPAIALIRSELDVIPLGDGPDYRRMPAAPLPRGFAAGGARGFAGGSWTPPAAGGGGAASALTLDVRGIPLEAVSASGEEAVFRFDALCDRPVGVGEYLWVAERFERITVVDVPDPATLRRDAALRFANLVDVLYDRGAALHVVAAGAPERLFEAAAPPRDAARAVSRLLTLPGAGMSREPRGLGPA